MSQINLTSPVPHFIYAYLRWYDENNLRTFISIEGSAVKGSFLETYVNERGVLLLNITTGAVMNLDITDKVVSFNARFSGAARDVVIPLNKVLNVFSPDAQIIGMGFSAFNSEEESETTGVVETAEPHTVVKSFDANNVSSDNVVAVKFGNRNEGKRT